MTALRKIWFNFLNENCAHATPWAPLFKKQQQQQQKKLTTTNKKNLNNKNQTRKFIAGFFLINWKDRMRDVQIVLFWYIMKAAKRTQGMFGKQHELNRLSSAVGS